MILLIKPTLESSRMAKVAKNIAVIGAGYTGLVAGVRLAEAGHKITILERGDQIGGLASGFKVEGSSLERGYHHLFHYYYSKNQTNFQ